VRPPALLLLLSLLAGCSSPTGPTPPPTQNPPPNPGPSPAPEPPPQLTISCPANATVDATSPPPVAVNFAAPTTGGGVAPVQLSCTRQSGSLFAAGPTPVQCTATDSATPPQTTSCVFTVTVNPPAPQLARTRLLAFGDSITAGEVTSPVTSAQAGDWLFQYIVVPTASYPSQLASLLRARYTTQVGAIQVVNEGRPGEWAEDGVRRLPGVMSSARPEALLLLHGYNELASFGTAGPGRAALYIDTMAKEGRNRGARVFIANLTPPRLSGTRALSAVAVADLNARIRATAVGEGAVFVDLYAALAGDIQRYIGVDGLHPTEAGYARIAQTFFDAIRADLEVR
jgi:lysophospholipase L1-like esterase